MKDPQQTVSEISVRQEMERYADRVSTKDVKDVVDKESRIKPLFTSVGSLSRFADDFGWVFKMLKDYLSGRYRTVPWRTITLLVGAVSYALSPLDLIPDFLPVLGWSDDALLLAAVLGSVRVDIEEYKKWKSAQGQTSASVDDLAEQNH